jgi:hypothetical protein
MTLYEQIKQLLPGDIEVDATEFTLLMYEQFQSDTLLYENIKKIYSLFLIEKNSTAVAKEYSDFMKYLKRCDVHLYRKFRFKIIEIYLNNKGIHTFHKHPPYNQGAPNILPDINYEILEPVLLLGERWRNVVRD